MSWPLVNLGELVDPAKGSLVSGPFGSNIGSRFFVDEGVPIIRGNNLTKGAERFLDEGFAFLTEQKASEFANCKALPGDIVLTAAGSIGQVGIIPENRKYDYYIISNKQIRARIDLRKAIPDFVYLWLSSSQMVRYIESQNNGGAVPLLNLSLVRRLPVPCPPLDEQARIAAMLSTYDDLIENNRRRIGLLEEAARLLYREWFVYFRFPGHEHVKITNGLPEGWERLPPYKLVADHIGGGWGKDEPAGKETEPAYVIRGTDIPEVENGKIDGVGLRFHGPKQLESRVLQPYDIIFEVSGGSTNQPIARTLIISPERLKQWDGTVICASFCKKFKLSTPEDAVFFYFHIREYRDRGDILIYQKESASSLKNFNFESFMNGYMIALPPASLRSMFFEQANDLVREQAVLSAQIVRLAEARDLLLPRLMSGEIAV